VGRTNWQISRRFGMTRVVVGALVVGLLGFTAASAEELKGKVKDVDKDKNTITLTVDGKDTTYTVGKDASFVTVSLEKGKKGKVNEKLTPIDGGITGIKAGTDVTVLTDKQDDKDVITSVKVSDGKPATTKKKKKKNPE
jgi:hypothetical protein